MVIIFLCCKKTIYSIKGGKMRKISLSNRDLGDLWYYSIITHFKAPLVSRYYCILQLPCYLRHRLSPIPPLSPVTFTNSITSSRREACYRLFDKECHLMELSRRAFHGSVSILWNIVPPKVRLLPPPLLAFRKALKT